MENHFMIHESKDLAGDRNDGLFYGVYDHVVIKNMFFSLIISDSSLSLCRQHLKLLFAIHEP